VRESTPYNPVEADAGKPFRKPRAAEIPGQRGASHRFYFNLADCEKPVVAAVPGLAIGIGCTMLLHADLVYAAPEARFSANFARLGFHQGFGLSVTLPRLVGEQAAAELLYTGRRVGGEEAVALGLADRLAPLASVRESALAFAAEIAGSAPLAVESIRATLRGDLADRVGAATVHEAAEQARLRATADFAEGTRAMIERRPPAFRRA
jgi:enoyl-CoA hydratase/carnithine racemase